MSGYILLEIEVDTSTAFSRPCTSCIEMSWDTLHATIVSRDIATVLTLKKAFEAETSSLSRNSLIDLLFVTSRLVLGLHKGCIERRQFSHLAEIHAARSTPSTQDASLVNGFIEPPPSLERKLLVPQAHHIDHHPACPTSPCHPMSYS